VFTSLSNCPIPAVAITPIAPAVATAEANPYKEMPTPIPPWIIGILALMPPIDSVGIFSKIVIYHSSFLGFFNG
jgi:hypothetical protein